MNVCCSLMVVGTKGTVSQTEKQWHWAYFYGADMELKAHNLLHFLFWDPNLSGILFSHTLSFYKLEVFSLLEQLPGIFASYFAPFYFHIHALSLFEHTAILLHKFFIPCACARQKVACAQGNEDQFSKYVAKIVNFQRSIFFRLNSLKTRSKC